MYIVGDDDSASREKGAFMNKGYCEKREGKDCSKCLHENNYYIDEPPCKHYIYNNKGYEGTLKDIEGIKMRRQWFLTPAVLSFYHLALLSLGLMIFFLFIQRDMPYEEKEKGVTIILWFFLYFVIPFEICLLILSVFNLKFFGKTVAVLTDDGIYTNQVFLKWREITEIEFFPHEYYYRGVGENAYVKISSKKGTYKIAHMPLLFLHKAKKYNPEIKTKISKKEIKWHIITFVVCIVGSVVLCFIDI